MFIRKYWLPLSVLVVLICAVGLYYLQTQPPKEPIVMIKPVEPLPKSEVKDPVGDTSQGGHFHADGTWHDEPHEGEVQPSAEVSPPQPQTQQQQQDGPLVISQTPPIPDTSVIEKLNVPSYESLQVHYKALSEWRKKHDEASAEWTASIENVLQVLPEEGLAEYLENLSDAERQELSVKIDDLIEKRKAASEKLKSVRLERPVRPQTK